MSNVKYKMEFEALCRHSELGELVKQPVSMSGGLLHRMYALETTKGKFAVKLLNPNIMTRQTAMQNYINSEKIAGLLANKIPALPAERLNENFVQNVNGQFYLVFTWVEGNTLNQEEIVASHCAIIGGILADIHQTDFSELAISREKLPNRTLTDWDHYVQLGRKNGADWTEVLHENLEDLKEWNICAARAAEYLSSNMVLSHRDLDPKNVLWKEYNPVLIDWESAGFIHPMQDLIETAIYWSVKEIGETNQQKFFSFIDGYQKKCGELHADWELVLATGFSGKLDWLEYSLKRSLRIECTDEEEQRLGTEQVIATLAEINNYAEEIPKLRSWVTQEL